MENPIKISYLNDFLFCPISIYFHQLYGETDKLLMQSKSQINGSNAHTAVDEGHYSSRAEILQGIWVFSEQYGLIGQIDTFDEKKGVLTERKNKIKRIYDGYVLQLYAECLALREMGYVVNKLNLYSFKDNKSYNVSLPEEDLQMKALFVDTIKAIRSFDFDSFAQENPEKCRHCIYEPACDRCSL